MENIGDNLAKFLRAETWWTSSMFGFIASSIVLVPMRVDCAALDTKCLVDELERNARLVFLAQNPTCVEALLAERRCRSKSFILPQAVDDLGEGRDSHILPECAGQVSNSNKRK
jgi:hypothetical protein